MEADNIDKSRLNLNKKRKLFRNLENNNRNNKSSEMPFIEDRINNKSPYNSSNNSSKKHHSLINKIDGLISKTKSYISKNNMAYSGKVLELQKPIKHYKLFEVDLTEDTIKDLIQNCKSITNECCICYEIHICINLSCNHIFCFSCINKWIDMDNDLCPICKGKLKDLIIKG